MKTKSKTDRIREVIMETLYRRYKKICEENKMCFENYQVYCYESAKKEIIGNKNEPKNK
jgi:hypothetical protein